MDVLKRHLTNHEDDGHSAKRRRKAVADGNSRVAKACRACAAAKLKCEDEKPCQRCRQKQVQCISSDIALPEPDISNDIGSDVGNDWSSSALDQSYQPTQDELHTHSLIMQDATSYGLDGMAAPTTSASTQPKIDHNYFPSSSLQLPPPANFGADPRANANESELMPPLAILEGASNNVDFPTDFSPDFDESSLAYFLNDIMVPPIYNAPVNQQYQPRTPRDFLDFGIFNMDTLDMDAILGESTVPLPSAEHWDASEAAARFGNTDSQFRRSHRVRQCCIHAFSLDVDTY